MIKTLAKILLVLSCFTVPAFGQFAAIWNGPPPSLNCSGPGLGLDISTPKLYICGRNAQGVFIWTIATSSGGGNGAFVNAGLASGSDICQQISNSVTSLPASGGTVQIPAGNYAACATGLSISKANVVLQGAGRGPGFGTSGGTTINFPSGVAGITITAGNVTVSDAILISADTAANSADNGVVVSGGTVTLARLTANNFGGAGFYTRGNSPASADQWHYEDLQANNNFGDGYKWDCPATDNDAGHISGSLAATSNGGWGVEVLCGNGNVFDSFVLTNNALGGVSLSASSNSFPHLYVEGGTGSSFIINSGVVQTDVSFKAFGIPTTIQDNSGTNENAIDYWGGVPTLPTGPNNVPQYLTETPAGGIGLALAWALQGVPDGHTPTCASNADTIVSTDRGSWVVWNDASACAASLPGPGTTGFANNWFFRGINTGAGTVTLTPGSGTVTYTDGANVTSGAASVPIASAQDVSCTSLDNTNYFCILKKGTISFPLLGNTGNTCGAPPYSFTGITTTGIIADGNGLYMCQGNTVVGQWFNSKLFMAKPICDFAVGNGCITWANSLIQISGSSGALFNATNNKGILTADFTSANSAALQAITGLAVTIPNSSATIVYSFHCAITYSQATNVAGDQFGIASLTNAPTNLHAWANVATNTGAATPFTTGDSGNINTTTPTAIVTFQPGNTGVNVAYIDGAIETNNSGQTMQIYVLNGTAADVIVIKRDSYCHIY